jgi:Yip1 domain
MPTTTQASAPALQDRVRRILTTPKTEWPVIEAESTDVASLYKSYIAILAAIPAIGSFIGMTVFGITLPFVGTIRTPVVSGFAQMIVSYCLGLVSVYISALIIDKLAPTFNSTPNMIQALKLVAYSSTAVWIAGVLQIIPALGLVVVLAALYSIYLFYLGLPVLMKTPAEKVIPYMVVAAVVAFVLYIVMGAVTGLLFGAATIGTNTLS